MTYSEIKCKQLCWGDHLSVWALLIRICTANTWTIWRNLSPRRGQLWPTGGQIRFIRNQTTHVENWKGLLGRHLVQSDNHLFLSMASDLVGEKSASREANRHKVLTFEMAGFELHLKLPPQRISSLLVVGRQLLSYRSPVYFQETKYFIQAYEGSFKYFSKYSLLRSKYFCMYLNQLSKHFGHSDWDIFKTCVVNAFSVVEKRSFFK